MSTNVIGGSSQAAAGTWNVAKPQTAASAVDQAGAGAGVSGVSNSQTSLKSLGSTFLQLLTQELQNQDPTSPMDSTQMVGQMISLNQLDQIASINQLLTSTLGQTTPAAPTGSPAPTH